MGLLDLLRRKKEPKLRRPEPDKVMTTIKLPEDIWRKAKIYALEHGKTLAEVIEDALRDYCGLKPRDGAIIECRLTEEGEEYLRDSKLYKPAVEK